MSRNRLYILVSTCLTLFMLVACTMPASKGLTAVPTVAYTQAVQTVVANLTTTPGTTPQATALPTPVQETKALTEEPTDTPVPPTATTKVKATATPAASPEVSSNPSDPATGLANPDWHEGFDGTGSWYTYQDEFIRFQAQGNKLEMIAYQANNRNGWALAPQLVSGKFYVEMTATFGDACKGADRFGLMLSPVSSADKGYLFGISCEGKYVLWNWDGTRMTNLVNWTASNQIQSGTNKTNRIGIRVDGNKLSLYSNGNLLTDLTDKTYAKLYFGIFIGSVETTRFTVQVSGMSYWSLP
jgi:hypothetical protein